MVVNIEYLRKYFFSLESISDSNSLFVRLYRTFHASRLSYVSDSSRMPSNFSVLTPGKSFKYLPDVGVSVT